MAAPFGAPVDENKPLGRAATTRMPCTRRPDWDGDGWWQGLQMKICVGQTYLF